MTTTGPKRPGALRLVLVILAAASAACSSSRSSPEPTPSGVTAFKVHYHRPDGAYAGWTLEATAGSTAASVAASATDGFGAEFAVTPATGATTLTFSLRNGGAVDGAGTLGVSLSGPDVYVFSGRAEAYAGPLPAVPGPNQLALYYKRTDGLYTGWGLHVWGDQATNTSWGGALQAAGAPHARLGVGFLIPLTRDSGAGNCTPGRVCVIVHKGDTKDPGPDMSFDPAALGSIVFVTSGSSVITSTPRVPGEIDIAGAAAHLLSRTTLAWNPGDATAVSFEVRFSSTAEVRVAGSDVVGGRTLALTPDPAGLPSALRARAPQLASYAAFSLDPAVLATVEEALKGQLVAVARNASGAPVAATAIQTAYALDDLYAYDGPLGVTFVGTTPTVRLWAPTVQAPPLLHVFDDSAAHLELAGSPFTMAPDAAPGVWTYSGPSSWYGLYYRYELSVYHPTTGKVETLTVTDPYAVNLSTNGAHAQIVDLADPALKPAGWDALVKPALDAPEDIVVYESHVRDFSANDPTVPAAHRGKYLAFEDPSNATSHLQALADAGLTHVHLLPVFDIASVDEDPANRVDVDQPYSALCALKPATPSCGTAGVAGKTVAEVLSALPGDSDQQQAIVQQLRGIDGFNWGYDPLHYGAPEGSYASTAEGTAKIVEFRRMVKALASLGLRVVMDVVYNHTNAAGVGTSSVLDKVVPGYYHRLDPATGYVLTSSCCANTATEHHMMGRLMNDTLVRWARDYKVDGFRFDLMGLHMQRDVLAAGAALAALTPGTDGVDGSKIYVYGEGWSMGETADGSWGVPATQLNMAGTGIGTFNDRIRDYVRGGGPFDNFTTPGNPLRAKQGFATGVYTDPNELGTTGAAAREALLNATDGLKASLAGNLGDFRMVTSTGGTVYARAIGYNGAAAAYAGVPKDSINYVSAHDNQILFDIVQHKLPAGRSMADRVRVQELALDTVLLAQGIPFLHMGDDILRSKSCDKNSYDSGDWFNRIDWSGQANGWRSGLPPAGDNQPNWPAITPLFADATIAPSPADIAATSAHVQAMLNLRRNMPLLRLRTAADVKARVDFLNSGPSQVPGVVVMTVTDGLCAGADLDPRWDAAVVILNADVASHTMTVPGASGFAVHPLLPVAGASVAGDAFTVPARASAVFVQAQAGAQGAGLSCNTR